MKKIKTFIKSFLWLALYGVSFFLILLFMLLVFRENKIQEFKALYPLVDHQMIDNMFNAFLKTSSFKTEFYDFLEKHLCLYSFLNLIPLLLFAFKYCKIKPKKITIARYSLIQIMILTSTLSIGLNIVLSHFSYNEINLSIWYLLLSGIIGPITEELLFRGILYQKLQESFTKKTSFIMMIIIFTMLHQNITTMIYACVMGIWFTYLFEKYKNIKVPIFAHMIGNLLVPLIMPYIYIQSKNYKIGILFFLGMMFIFTLLQIKKQENND